MPIGAASSLDLTKDLSLRVGASTSSTLLGHQWVVLDDLWGADTQEALAAEARAVWEHAHLPTDGPGNRTSRHRPHQWPTLLAQGPVLRWMHEELTTVARSITGQLLEPSITNYAFYEDNDEVQLHYDIELADLTMITETLCPLGPLHVHPELTGFTLDQLDDLEADPVWDRESGIPVQHPTRGLTAMRGKTLAHHRPGRSLEGLGAVASFFYRRRY